MPVAHTMTGKGAIACTDPLSAGLFGRYDRIANALIDEADVLLVVGCKLGEIATKRFTIPPKGKTVIHLDIVAGGVRPHLSADGGAVGRRARGHPRPGGGAVGRCQAAAGGARRTMSASVAKRMAAWKAGVMERLTSARRPSTWRACCTSSTASMPADGILVADGGFAAHWAGLLYDTKQAGRGFVPDRGFASIGYGLPGAIGAALAAKGRPVVSLTGDGGFNMSLGDLETARRMGLSFAIVVFNNAASGYVKALQHLMYGEGAYQSSDLAETNYAKVAEAMGCVGIRVENPDDLAGAFSKGLAAKGVPTVIDVVVTRDPARMLPAVDNRTVQVKKGDRVA